ncbi:MAG TPA: response regulator [Terriglobia bacterium]|nr:response regulator [Terriglobia bacterium]
MKVLVADAENQHLFLMELFLKKWGYPVCSVDNGAEALHLLETETEPCIAILDWELPGCTGLEIARRVKASGRRNIYIILLTARTQAKERAEAAAAGIDLFMAKPYEPDELRQALAAGGRRLEKPAGSPA